MDTKNIFEEVTSVARESRKHSIRIALILSFTAIAVTAMAVFGG